MAELAVIMSMITVTSTATSVLGIIKRRCSASRTTTERVSKCAELVSKIRKLLKTLEEDAQVPRDTRRISTALDLRCEEFDAVLKNLEKMKQHTKRTHPIDRTENFIKAQGWAKKIEAIYNDLVHLRNGIENIASTWDVAMLVTRVEEMVTIDATKQQCSEKWERHTESVMWGSETMNYIDQIQMTMVKLTDANKEALNRYGKLHELSLPDALYESSLYVGGKSSLELLQRAAELLHPVANFAMGVAYKYGGRVEKNLELALSHFRVASSRDNIHSVLYLIAHCDSENDRRKVSRYAKMASRMSSQWDGMNLWLPYPIGYDFELDELEQHLIQTSNSYYAFHKSLCHFFGLDAPQSNRKAIDALQTFGFSSYSVQVEEDNSNSFCILPHHSAWAFPGNSMHEFLNFLFDSNQFSLFFNCASSTEIYSPRELKSYALCAAESQSVDAHIFLAEHYSSFKHRNEPEMERHLRIAADSGHSQAQSVCHQLFGRRANVSKGVKLERERSGSHRKKEKQRSHTTRSDKKEGDSSKKRTAQVSKKCDAIIK